MFKLKDILENHLIFYPTPKNLYYVWGFGSLLGIMLVVQVATGVMLAMHYSPFTEVAFDSIERIMREIPSGWLMRYLHSNGSSMLFILLYCHIARGFYFHSFKKPKQWVWCSGVILFILMAGIAFLGYTLPWGQMSFWGATVITNLLSAIPVVGNKLVVWVWGGFAINASTLNRFFSLHYFLSIIALALSGLHLAMLHKVGSTTPEKGGSADFEYTRFFPYFVVKDLVTLIAFIVFYLLLVFYAPNLFGHPDNYIRASALVTPAHIVPEWYFLPFYAMLKSVPSKLGGAFFMVASMLILLIMPWIDKFGWIMEPKFKPGFLSVFLIFVANMLLLGWLGGKAVDDNILPFAQFSTLLYFVFFMVFVPAYSFFEWGVLKLIAAKKDLEGSRYSDFRYYSEVSDSSSESGSNDEDSDCRLSKDIADEKCPIEEENGDEISESGSDATLYCVSANSQQCSSSNDSKRVAAFEEDYWIDFRFYAALLRAREENPGFFNEILRDDFERHASLAPEFYYAYLKAIEKNPESFDEDQVREAKHTDAICYIDTDCYVHANFYFAYVQLLRENPGIFDNEPIPELLLIGEHVVFAYKEENITEKTPNNDNSHEPT